eukprot:CAMPEP_0172621536 /NCGR_PEP_ID=MMETSP1068-20121228/113073_1 /TAXON_ID=35684 /ORGANISM="Pseudopedinella elastica, Strain CCMP716" /LENGTH=307 /DNA_ID=CAMNT_0013429323 /DNA_START=33 /DNA_END=952 /DNA_ORIENTATION=-
MAPSPDAVLRSGYAAQLHFESASDREAQDILAAIADGSLGPEEVDEIVQSAVADGDYTQVQAEEVLRRVKVHGTSNPNSPSPRKNLKFRGRKRDKSSPGGKPLSRDNSSSGLPKGRGGGGAGTAADTAAAAAAPEWRPLSLRRREARLRKEAEATPSPAEVQRSKVAFLSRADPVPGSQGQEQDLVDLVDRVRRVRGLEEKCDDEGKEEEEDSLSWVSSAENLTSLGPRSLGSSRDEAVEAEGGLEDKGGLEEAAARAQAKTKAGASYEASEPPAASSPWVEVVDEATGSAYFRNEQTGAPQEVEGA